MVGQYVMDYIVPMVGAAGFEPTTPRTPSECATGLRYAPTRPTSMLPTRLDAAARITGTLHAECESIIRMIAWRSPLTRCASSFRDPLFLTVARPRRAQYRFTPASVCPSS